MKANADAALTSGGSGNDSALDPAIRQVPVVGAAEADRWVDEKSARSLCDSEARRKLAIEMMKAARQYRKRR